MFKRLLLSLVLVGGIACGAEKAAFPFSTEVQAVVDRLIAEFRSTAGNMSARLEMCRNAAQELKELVGPEDAALLEQARFYELIAEVCESMDRHAMRRAFVCAMFNPYTYVDAVKKMWKADSCKDAIELLWTEYKSVVAGAALVTTIATGLFVAHKKGWFQQAEHNQDEQNDNA